MGHPTVYPTGVTIYNSDKAWNGYTIIQACELGAVLLDMNGKELRLWEGLHGFPNKIFPGGHILGHSGSRNPKYGMQDMIDLIQIDWEGNIVWKFNRYEYIKDGENEAEWMARAHHDYQREGSSTGYYSPGQEPKINSENTLILVHKNLYNKKISDKLLLDDAIIEVDWEGNVIWEWICSDHFDELGFDEAAKNVLFRDPNMRKAGEGMGDWMHINSMSTLGPNKWYDQGDERFHPDNIIWDARESNIIAIIEKRSGKIVWKLGPDYSKEELKHIGWIIGQHHAHMIPKGLPGEGNILVFDNGGWGGYGEINPMSKIGQKNALRDYSRILEINPVTLDIVWQYTPAEAGFPHPTDSFRFYSPYISSAQRLENGNTLIDEGADGRIFEVTPEHEIVWEFISPYWGKTTKNNMIYRAYRIPYDWIPQLEKPEEKSITAPDIRNFRLPNAAKTGAASIIKVEGLRPYEDSSDALCIIVDQENIKRSPKLFTIDREIFTENNTAEKKEAENRNEEKILVLFGAERCVHCKNLYLILVKIISKYKNKLKFEYIDVDKKTEFIEKYQIRGIPTLIVFEKGKILAQSYGEKSEAELIEFFNDIENRFL